MVQPIVARNIPADFLTSNHYLLGQVKVTNTGLMGLLSDVNSRYVELNDASIARIVKPDKIINYSPLFWLVKQQIIAVCLSKRDYVGSATLIRAGYTRLQPYPMQIVTPVYEIQATLQWSGRFEFSALMSEGTSLYFILYDAVITASLFPALHIEAPAVLLNRNFLEAMSPTKG